MERQDEFRTILSALSEQPDSCGIVLVGDAGVGKTTLARLVTKSLPQSVSWVAGTESARSIPLGVFAHLVGPSTSRDPVTFLASARATLLSDGNEIIGVDDAHLLDQLSATLLHQLAMDGAIRIVATVRSGESVPDAITSLWKDGYLLRLDLSPFSKKQSVGLIESALGGHLEALSADLMWKASGGNALFVRHLVEGALEAGTLRQVRGVWQLRGRTAVTSELASLLDNRIDQLPESTLHVLKLLTFCEPIDIDTMSELAGSDALEDAETRGLVRVVQDKERLYVQYNHPLFGEVIRGRLGVAASRRLRGELVKVLRNRPITGSAERVRLAELTLESDQQADVRLLVDAAQDAVFLANLPLGERFARAALSRGAGFEAADFLAQALLWQGHASEAEGTLTVFDASALTQTQLVRWGLARVSNLLWAMGDSEAADDVLVLLHQRVTEPPLVLIVEGTNSACSLFENRLDEAVALSTKVLDDAHALPWAVAWAAFGGGLALALMGRGDSVAAVAARGHAVEDRCNGLLRFPAGIGEIQALTLTGNLVTARERADAYIKFSSAGQYLAWALANVLVGTVELAEGKLASAAERMEQTIAAMTSDAAASWSFPARLIYAQSFAALGRTAIAGRMLAEIRTRSGRHIAVFEPQMKIAEAWFAAAEGNVSAAVDFALAAADLAAATSQRGIEVAALHDAVRFGDHRNAERLATVAATVDGALAPLYVRHAVAAADNDARELLACAMEFERIGALLSAADTAAQASLAFVSAQDRPRAADAGAMAHRLAARCGGLQTPALLEAANPLPLTSREREIANLVAAGLSNKDIAQRLTVSVRTVEGHLYRACIKCDVSDREGLAALVKGALG